VALMRIWRPAYSSFSRQSASKMHQRPNHGFDGNAIAGLYRAAAGSAPWSMALQRVTDGYGGLGTQFICIDKVNSALTFSAPAGAIQQTLPGFRFNRQRVCSQPVFVYR